MIKHKEKKMKKLFFGIALAMMSIGAFAESYLEDSARLYECGGIVELRSYEEQGSSKYALKFIGVEKCSNVRLGTGKSYKLTDKDGNFQTRSFTLSNEAVSSARFGLSVLVESNSGSTSDSVSVTIRDRQPAPRPYQEPRQVPRQVPQQQQYESAEWN